MKIVAYLLDYPNRLKFRFNEIFADISFLNRLNADADRQVWGVVIIPTPARSAYSSGRISN